MDNNGNVPAPGPQDGNNGGTPAPTPQDNNTGTAPAPAQIGSSLVPASQDVNTPSPAPQSDNNVAQVLQAFRQGALLALPLSPHRTVVSSRSTY